MSILDDIVADVEIEMTEDLIRAFKIEGCEPACHCCWVKLEAGKLFKLAVVETVTQYGHKGEPIDEMLCSTCTPDILVATKKRNAEQNLIDLDKSRRGGYSRKHRDFIS